ncbi:Sensor histidine kinase RcsC [bioreactor metagenome]|uniref:histidine kinase n=1 Tax=bioreactor metagenome TaxID=1076179 RepID=A0A644W878_9ZZZZ|nr:response regulator [Paludibacter sp.]
MPIENVKILAIDDNRDNLTIIKALINEAFPKAQTIFANDGFRGLELAFEKEPDIILLDIIMPGMDGYEVCKKLKVHPITADIPVVFITAIKDDKQSRIKALEAGGEGFLSKPVDISELTAQIRAMLKIREATILKRGEKERLENLIDERTRELQKTHAETLNLLKYFQAENEKRKKSEAALKESEEKTRLFKRAVDSSSVGIIITDIEGKIIYTNPFYLKISGYRESELIGQLSTFLDANFQPETFNRKRWKNILSGKDWSGEIKNIKKNGESYWVKAVISPIVNTAGEITNFIVVSEDITQKKQLLEDLITAKEKAEESDKLKTAFLANMSHEIRTPMNGILGFAELLKEQDLTNEIQQKYIHIIEKSGARMLNIINNIVDISKIEAGLMEITLTDSDINEQIDYIYNFFKPEVEAKGMQLYFKKHYANHKAIIKTDQEKLYAIFTNLVKNAIKYSYRGYIEFGYYPEQNEQGRDLMIFYVKDTGIGIHKDKTSIIFDRFRQVSEGKNRHYEGAGLGLSITKSYVEMLGGKIWVESEEGVGSRFCFSLPYNHTNLHPKADKK